MVPVQTDFLNKRPALLAVAALALITVTAIVTAVIFRSFIGRQLLDDTDRPVIITGNSLDLDFNHADYDDDKCGSAGSMQKYCSTDNQITALTVWDNSPKPPREVCSNACPGGNCTMTVTYNEDSDSIVIIKSDTGNKQVNLEFDASKLPLHPSSGSWHYNGGARITSVLVVDDNTNQKTCELGEGKYTIKILGQRQ